MNGEGNNDTIDTQTSRDRNMTSNGTDTANSDRISDNQDEQDMQQTDSVKVHIDNEGTEQDFGIIYKVDDYPPWYLCPLLGFQVQ